MTLTESALHIVSAAGLGAGIAALYAWARPRGRGMAGLASTLMLLAPLIAMVTIGVGDSVATAFTLVGTLAIVRFRTSIRDPQDTAYVIFAVAVGVAAGNRNLPIALVGSAILGALVVAVTLMERRRQGAAERRELMLVVTPPDLGAVPWAKVLEAHGAAGSVEATAVDHKAQTLTLTVAVDGLRTADVPKVVLALLEHPEVRSAGCRPARE